jgi:hypothetical protein
MHNGHVMSFGLVAGLMACWTSIATADVQLLQSGQGWSTAVSNNGVVAGSSTGSGEYFIWTPAGGHQIIGGVSAGNGAGGQAGISADGAVVCGTLADPMSGEYTAGQYTIATATWTSLGGLGASCDNSVSSGWGMSGDGSTLVGLGWDGCSAYATYWESGGEGVSLGTTSPGNSTRANGVNHDGSVIVGWQDGNGRQGAVWINGDQQLITLPSGGAAGEASAVSSKGEWVAGIGIGSIWGVGDTWRYNTLTQSNEAIPNLDTDGGRYMAGMGISDDGSMLVGGTWPFGVPASFGNAFVWREGVGTEQLPAYFDDIGVSYPAGFTFAFVSGMSDDGRWLTGWGNSGSPGNTVTWVVELPGDSTPCPADINGDGLVDVVDVLALLAAWGTDGADINGDGITDVVDLLVLIAAWGEC